MPAFQPGEVVLVLFPFTDGTSVKKRPAVVLLDDGGEDLLLARITTQRYQSAFDIELLEWAQAGLKAPSWVRLHKLASLEKTLVNKSLGSLSSTDWQKVCQIHAEILRLMQKRD